MLIRHRIYHRMADPVAPAAILPVTGAVVRAADHKCVPPQHTPGVKQAPKLPVHIAKRRGMSRYAVVLRALQIKIIRIVHRVHIDI